MQLFSKWICRFLKGDEEKKKKKKKKNGGEESGIHNNPPQNGILCMWGVCVDIYVYVCFLINLYLLFSEAHIIFGNGIKHKKKKKHEKCLFSLSARSFIHFPASRGAFFFSWAGAIAAPVA